mmetsp:Transcript_32097/g.36046  ORF Transcript_32097/g.36046 Transcript_32097/m.36046 type:complete len:155 (-) Transcript_32097:293-757(-)
MMRRSILPTNNTDSTFKERIQNVIFVRHGIALHNIPPDPPDSITTTGTGECKHLQNPELYDPPLVYQGKQQALHVSKKYQEWCRSSRYRSSFTSQSKHHHHAGEVELVVTSPLTRCIQTAMLAFLPGDRYTTTTMIPTTTPPTTTTTTTAAVVQ